MSIWWPPYTETPLEEAGNVKNCTDYKPVWPGPPVGDAESKEEGRTILTNIAVS